MKSIQRFFVKEKQIVFPGNHLKNVSNILVVKQHNQLGDMLCTLPLLAAVRKKFPRSHITLIASPFNCRALLNDEGNYFDEIIIYRKSNLLHLLGFYKMLRAKKYDIGLVPSTVSISRTSHLLNRFSGARITVGAKSIDGKQNEYSYLLNIKSDYVWKGKNTHQVQKNLDIAKQIGCDLNTDEIYSVSLSLSDKEINFAKEYLVHGFPDKTRPVIAFHPGAGKLQNRWSTENYIELISLLRKKYNAYILITSGYMDVKITDEIAKSLKERDIPFKIIEKPTIREIGAVLSMINLYITNDTGTMHVAGYCGAKVLSLFAQTKGYEWSPLKKYCTYIQSPDDDINKIGIDEVFNEACKIISGIKFQESDK